MGGGRPVAAAARQVAPAPAPAPLVPMSGLQVDGRPRGPARRMYAAGEADAAAGGGGGGGAPPGPPGAQFIAGAAGGGRRWRADGGRR